MHEILQTQPVTDKELLTFLNGLPDEKTIEFAAKIISFVERNTPSVRHQLISIIDANPDDRIKFNAFYTLSKLYLRYDGISDFQKIVDNVGGKFSDKVLYNVIQSHYYRHLRDEESLKTSLEFIKEAKSKLSDHCGILIHFAEIVADCIDRQINIDDDLYNEACDSVNKAIRLNKGYPKYYFIKGRLLAYKGHFEQAKEQIMIAIDNESLDKYDYAIRIGKYRYYLQYIQALESTTKLDLQIKSSQKSISRDFTEIQKQIKESTTRNVELLAFFAGVLSLIIGASNLISKFDFKDAASLLMILAGTLIVSFSLLRRILSNANSWKETAILVLFGILLILSGYLSNYYIKDENISKELSNKAIGKKQ